jgi:hypothetical protein
LVSPFGCLHCGTYSIRIKIQGLTTNSKGEKVRVVACHPFCCLYSFGLIVAEEIVKSIHQARILKALAGAEVPCWWSRVWLTEPVYPRP